jgi:vancomycin resistance protein YoaR
MRADAALSPARHPRPDLEERRRAKARAARQRRLLLIGGVAAVLAVVLGAGIGFAGSNDRIADGVTIDGVDVGGLTASEARTVLERRAAGAAATPVVFTAGGESFSIRPRKLAVTPDWDAAVEEALDAGDGFLVFRGFKRIALRISGSDVAIPVSARERALDKQIERFASAIDRKPREAAIVLEELQPVVVPGRPGVALDRVLAKQVVLGSLSGFDRGQPVALPTRVTQPEVTATDLGPVVAQVRTALSAPVRLGFRKRNLKITPRKLATFLVLPSGGSAELSVGGDAAKRYFAGVAKALDREPENAGFTLDGNGRVHVVRSKDGRAFDVRASQRRLLAAALSPTARTGELVVKTATPRITTKKAKAMGIVGVVGTYTTTYGGDASRIHNVQLVANLLDDHLIAPGEVFSFNQTTGERNAGKGFQEAPVIINGELKTGIGGGVCQVSTTVFNSAFEAGLSIEERTNHALYISHYPTGRDATVNYPGTDLKFKNDTGNWLWIRTFVGSSSLTVNLYGTPVDRRVEIETSPLEVISGIPVQEVDDPNLYVGEEAIEDSGEPARSVSVRRIVYDKKGKILYDTTWSSRYLAEPRIVHVGTKEKPKETETPATTAEGETQPAETQPAETQPAETQPAETQPAQTQPAQTQPAGTSAGETTLPPPPPPSG